MIKQIVIFFAVIIFSLSLFAQSSPKEGQPCPDFKLNHIKYFNKKQASLKDFRGKWLLLDFWSTSCGACIAAFPHINEIQKELGDQVQVVMVGEEADFEKLDYIYSKYRTKLNLLVPCAFDTVLYGRFDIAGLPRYLLVDDKGIVRCFTNRIRVEHVKAFLAGDHPVTNKVYGRHEEEPVEETVKKIPFDDKGPFMIAGNGAPDTAYLYRSLLAEWKPSYRVHPNDNIKDVLNSSPGRFESLCATLKNLYQFAYFGTTYLKKAEFYGKISDSIILDVADKSLFKSETDFNTYAKNMFCYSLEVPSARSSVEYVQQIMQSDLRNYFGYNVNVETRKMPYWAVISSEGANKKLGTKGEVFSFKGDRKTGFEARNISFHDLVENILRDNMQLEIIFDESGITGNVDINMNCDGCVLTDIMDVKKILQKNGLDLVKKEKDMQVIVIREGKNK